MWIARRYIGLDAKGVGRYKKQTLGMADDFQDADGRGVLSYAQAQKLAHERADEAAAPGHAAPLTVRQAMDDYLAWRRPCPAQQRGGDAARQGRGRTSYPLSATIKSRS